MKTARFIIGLLGLSASLLAAPRPSWSGYNGNAYLAQQIWLDPSGNLVGAPTQQVNAPWNGSAFTFGMYVYDETNGWMIGATMAAGNGVSYNPATEALTFGINSATQTAMDSITTSMAGKMPSNPGGTSAQFIKGDGTLGTSLTLLSQFTNDPGFITTAALGSYATTASVTAALGNYTTTSALLGNYTNTASLTTLLAGKEPTITAGTTGQYWRGDKTWQTLPTSGSGTVTSVGVLSTDLSTSGGPVTTNGNITLNLNTSGVTAGMYTNVTVTNKGIVTAGTTYSALTPPTFSTATTATVLDAGRWTDVSYSFPATVTISLIAGQSVTATLKYADNAGMSTNAVTVDVQSSSNSGVLNLTQTNTLKITGKIPPGKYRQVTFAVSGTGATSPSALSSGQETLL